MKRLYLKLYLAFVALLLGALLAAALAARRLGPEHDFARIARPFADMFVETLPEPSDARFAAALAERAHRLSVHLALWNADGRLIASSGGDPPMRSAPRPGWFHAHGRAGIVLRLGDGRFLGMQRAGGASGHGHFFWALSIFAAAMALGCYPIARRITRRLERLKHGMDRFAAGDLAARVPVQGRDEVASVTQSFNEAAARIETLVEQQRGVLAAASHELRSPLARVRVAVELLSGEDPVDRAKLSSEAVRDVEELDHLIGDLLEAARVQGGGPVRAMEDLDLGELVAAQAEQYGASVAGEGARFVGDRRMLERLVRNLLENARRHGGGQDVRVTLAATAERITLAVEDRGPGVAEADRERIFEPFYRPAGHREGRDGGVGLGLSLVRQIARYHGGRAFYEARAGGGSRFVVELARPSAR